MSATQEGERRSTDSESTTVTCENASQIMRLAEQRQSTEDVEPGLPDETHVDGSTDVFFDEDGNLVDAETVQKQTKDEPSDLEEWLEAANPERYGRWKKAVENDMFPEASARELLNHAVQNEIEAAEDNDEVASPDVTGVRGLVINTHQDVREDIWASVDFEEDETGGGAECPECESTNTSSYQQQTGGADEGMTSFHKCANCGKSWRGGYAS